MSVITPPFYIKILGPLVKVSPFNLRRNTKEPVKDQTMEGMGQSRTEVENPDFQ